MSASVQELLYSFDLLTENEKRELASEILRRASMLDQPPLTDEDLVLNAERLFLELDRHETADEQA